MNEITKKLHKAGLEKLKPLVEQLVIEGADRNVIIQTAKRYTESKVNAFYDKVKGLQPLNSILPGAITPLREQGNSNAEVVFYHLLRENKIEFEFQYKIGPYIVDYLLYGELVIELDGPQHIKEKDEIRNKYLRKMGYRVIHVPIFIVALDARAVMIEIINASIECLEKPQKIN